MADHGILPSVGRTGICYDNAAAESFNGTLKKEIVNRKVHPTRAHPNPGCDIPDRTGTQPHTTPARRSATPHPTKSTPNPDATTRQPEPDVHHCPKNTFHSNTRPDLVQRDFTAKGPNQLWVADITYARTAKGFVYATFVTDVFSRRIVGWALSGSMKTEALPLQALNQAIWNAKSTAGLIHHSDHGSQYVSLTYHQHLVDAGIVESTGSVGDSYDNALAENVNGSYKNEIIHTRRWADVLEVEIATFEWVNWWNTKRLHQALDYRTPAEVETDYWQQHQLSATITNRVNA